MTTTTQTVQGRQALHTITVMDQPMTEAEAFRADIKRTDWMPETGKQCYGFSSCGQASRWLKIYLGKPGWPDPVSFEIWPCVAGDGRTTWSCYIVEEAR